MKPNTLLAYHFTDDTLRGGRPLPKINTWLSHEGPIVPCRSGLHASVHPYDALTYSPGNVPARAASPAKNSNEVKDSQNGK